jgi:hypothetical protein
MLNPSPFTRLLHLHPHKTSQVFIRTSWAHFGPYAGVLNDEPHHSFYSVKNFFIQSHHLSYNLLSPDIILQVLDQDDLLLLYPME